MKLSRSDRITLAHAADVADAQRELIEIEKRRSGAASRRDNRISGPASIAALAVMAVVSVVALGSLA
jgi:hypothetical protein